MKATTTVFELSKILKLSASTISRALKNHPDIAPETRRRVLDLAEKLDYEPNAYAVSLRTNTSKEFGVIVPSLAGFFYDSFISAVEELARSQGYSLIILISGDDPKVELDNLRICKQRRTVGIFISVTSRTANYEQFRKLQRQEIPVIFFDKVPENLSCHRIRFNDQKAATLAANHLIHKGKRKILSLFGASYMSITKWRAEAYAKVFDERGLNENYTIQYVSDACCADQAVMSAMIDEERPDAIFCMSDDILIGTIKALQVIGAQIPRDIGVLAISNGSFPKHYHPEVTYVETSAVKLGRLAFSHMMDYLSGQKDHIELSIEPVLVEGGSI
jgi:LacI family transcriptional regulator, galactose operon repressor